MRKLNFIMIILKLIDFVIFAARLQKRGGNAITKQMKECRIMELFSSHSFRGFQLYLTLFLTQECVIRLKNHLDVPRKYLKRM